MLASAGEDGTLQLWDVATRKPVGSPQAVEPNAYVAAVFTPDGARLYAVCRATARAALGDLAGGLEATRLPRRWARAERARVEDALPGRPYRAVCHGG